MCFVRQLNILLCYAELSAIVSLDDTRSGCEAFLQALTLCYEHDLPLLHRGLVHQGKESRTGNLAKTRRDVIEVPQMGSYFTHK